jgi:hypothetical protein
MRPIMDLFRPSQPAAPAPQPAQQQQPQKPQPGETGGTQLAGKTQGEATKEQAASPLEQYKDLWDPPKQEAAPGNPNPEGTPAAPKQPKFSDAAKKIDFSRLIPQELAAKALGGDVASFTQIINTVTQASLAASMHFADNHYGTKSKALEESINSALPEKFKQFSVNSTPFKNPALKHPAMQPVVQGIREQMRVKYPDASAEELTTMAEEYLGAALTESGRNTKPQEQADATATTHKQQANNEFNWDEYAGMAVKT